MSPLKTEYEGVTDVAISGTMSSGAASDWIDLPLDPPVYAIHAVCEGGAKWQIGGAGKVIVRDLVHDTFVFAPSAARAGMILFDAIPQGGASIRLFDTSSAENDWSIWIKYHTRDMP